MVERSSLADASLVRLETTESGRLPVEPRFTTRIAALVARIAALLEQLEQGESHRGAAFLRAMSDERTPADPERDQQLARLIAVWQLDELDLELLALALLPDEHEGYASVLQSLHPRAEPCASVGLAAQLLAGSPTQRLELRARVERGPLVEAGLLAPPDDAPCFNRSLLPGPGIAALLHGGSRWPSQVGVTLVEPATIDRSGFDAWLAQPSHRRALAALAERIGVELVVVADELESACARACVLLAAAGRGGMLVELLGDPPAGLAAQLGAYACALDRVPILFARTERTQVERALPELSERLGPTITCTTRERMQLDRRRATLVLECERLDSAGLRQAWAAALPRWREHAAQLGARFPLEPERIHAIATDLAVLEKLADRPLGPRELNEAIRRRAGISLRPGMRLRRPSAGWDRLILPRERLEQLHEALARVRHQATVIDEWGLLDDRVGARGVRLLFCGPPGTGKTLAAEVLAHALDTDLLIVDLSRLVSKWIGETEKNLAEVFAAAERSRAVLLFDEADALFAKRTEISDAHDRYANLETAYLLTRLEHYEGLAVLATNLRRNLDAAFMRRLEFVVEFEIPSRTERLTLWQVHLPSSAPLAADVELRELADFYAISGGLIRNAAIAAAFLAADAGGAITRAQLLRAIRREYEKTGAAFPGTPPTRRPT